MNSKTKKKLLMAAALALAIFAAVLALVARADTEVVRFRSLTAGEFVGLIAPLFLVALFQERVLEVFISGFRGLGAVAVKDDPCELARYKADTHRYAFLGGIFLGLVLAAAGVRALGLFVDPSQFATLGESQRQLFTCLDVLVTAGVLAGGSDALHQLVEVFTGFMEKARPRVADGAAG